MNDKIYKLFEEFSFIQNTDILVGKLPEKIIYEIDSMVEYCNNIKNDELSYLREHINGGKNKYQISVPPPIIDNSYILPFLNHMGELYVSEVNDLSYEDVWRKVVLRRHFGHFDGYDFWINYSYINDINPTHSHAGSLSGVIYIKNENNEETIFPEIDFSYCGKKGDIIMFPSELKHQVDRKQTTDERITIAYNMNFLG